jgi:predicted phage terminase large subunit-like protein
MLTIEKEKRCMKLHCQGDHLAFIRYFFKARNATKFRVNWHHHIIADALQDVIDGKRQNVVFNVSPGSSKTEEAIINFIARGLAINPRARFLHLSYSDDLALLNSQTARDLIQSDEYQAFWPMKVADDTKAKKRWNVEIDGKKAGGVYATSLQGQITGFRAGHMEPGFQGALIIDDPLKPEDAFSKTKLDHANRVLLSTVKSRRATPETPIILIMQRIAEEDPTGFIKAGGLGGEWSFIVIPAVIDEAYVATLDPKYQAMIDRAENEHERFSYWPYKERISELLAMERGEGTNQSGSRISRHVFASQYQQNPVAIGGNILHGEWFKTYTVLPKILYRKIYADTAQKTKERNDFSVFECWGLGDDGKMYLLDLIRGKWEAPELEKMAGAFWVKHKVWKGPKLPWVRNDPEYGQLREMIVEDKSSGTGLIQSIKAKNNIPIKAAERQKPDDKLTRVMDTAPYLSSGLAMVPEDAPFTMDFITECEAFTADDSHAHDDQIDCLCDATHDLLGSGNKLEKWKRLINSGAA